MEKIAAFDKTLKISLYLLVFLVPLWFLWTTQEVLIFQKQALLVILVSVALVAWLAKIVAKQELDIRISHLYWPVFAVLAVFAISTATSVWRYGSFWGWPLNVSDSFITVLFFVILYFLVSNIVDDEKELLSIFYIFIISAIIAGVYAILQLYKIFIIPLPFTQFVNFNTIGSINSIAILSAVMLPFSLTVSFALKGMLRWCFWIFTAIFLAIVLLINFFSAWITMIIGLLVLLFFGIWNFKKRMEFGWISFPMVLLVIALFFLTFRVPFPGAPVLPIEVSPSLGAEINMTWSALKENPVFGAGPGTFVLNYAKYHQAAINQTIFWGTRFSSGSSEILDWFMTKGVTGGISLISVMIVAIFLVGRSLIESDESDGFAWMIKLGLLASFLGIATANILYYSNFTMWLLFWLLLGGLTVSLGAQKKKISVAPPSFLAIISSFVFLLVLIFGLGLLFIGGQKYVAEIQYLKGAKLLSRGDIKNGTVKILSATNLNPSVDLYWRDLSQLYLSRISQIAADKNLSDEQRVRENQVAVNNAVAAANQAVAINPANVENWNVRGFVHRSLIGIQGADVVAIESYNKVSQLEPASPFSYAELGRVYLAQAQKLSANKEPKNKQDESLNMALENLNKAIDLKRDYAPAHYLIALVYEQQGKSDEAILKIAETARIAPNDAGLAFQLGVIYYQKNQFDNARIQFERVKALSSENANAKYMLGLVYDKQGQKGRAIEEFKKLSELNPNNSQLFKILENLNKNKPALDGIQPAQPPIQENPPEINSDKNKK